MDKKCFIIEDLLPLYNEGLLSPETTEWVKEHLEECEKCRGICDVTKGELKVEGPDSKISNDEMFKKINRKISFYQVIFVALSFFFAIRTSMLNNSFEFVLWYTVLGAITYLFYKDLKIVFLISFVPIFIWSVGEQFMSFVNGHVAEGVGILEYAFQVLQGSLIISFVHYIFAAIGSFMGFLIIKIKSIR